MLVHAALELDLDVSLVDAEHLIVASCRLPVLHSGLQDFQRRHPKVVYATKCGRQAPVIGPSKHRSRSSSAAILSGLVLQ